MLNKKYLVRLNPVLCEQHFWLVRDTLVPSIDLCVKVVPKAADFLKQFIVRILNTIHPNFGIVNEGVRPLLFTKLRISLNRDSLWYKKQLMELAFVH